VKKILENTCSINSYFGVFKSNKMDPYYGMQFTFSGHSVDMFNGEYTALDYSYNIDYIHFKNNNGMYLHYLPYWPNYDESSGYWKLHDSED